LIVIQYLLNTLLLLVEAAEVDGFVVEAVALAVIEIARLKN
jgi:hypothetical protein